MIKKKIKLYLIMIMNYSPESKSTKNKCYEKNRKEPKEQTQGSYDCNEIEPKMT